MAKAAPAAASKFPIFGSIACSRSVAGFRGFWTLQVARGINLVYGGGSVGLMGLIAQTVLDGGCSVLGYRAYLHILENSASVYNFMFELCYLSNVCSFCLIRLQGDSKSTDAA